jgi:hypothetical protein
LKLSESLSKQEVLDRLQGVGEQVKDLAIEMSPLWDARRRIKEQITRTFPVTGARPECYWDTICVRAYTWDGAEKRAGLLPDYDRVGRKIAPLQALKRRLEYEMKGLEDLLEGLDPAFKAARARARKMSRKPRKSWY